MRALMGAAKDNRLTGARLILRAAQQAAQLAGCEVDPVLGRVRDGRL